MSNGDKVGAGRTSKGALGIGPGSGIADTPIGKFFSGNLTREAMLESEKKHLAKQKARREGLADDQSAFFEKPEEEDVFGSELSLSDPNHPDYISSEGGSNIDAMFGDTLTGGGTLKRGNSAEIELGGVAPGPISDAKQAAVARQGMAEQARMEVRLSGFGMMANVKADLGDELGEIGEETRTEVEGYMDQADAQMQIAQELVDAARGNRINPGQFFANVGDAGKFSSSIAIAAGYMAQTSLGGVNLASQIIDQAINRNVRGQETNQLHDRQMVTQQLSFVDKIRQLGVDRGNIGSLYQTMLIAITQAQLDSIKYATASAETRAMIDQMWAGLDVRYWEGLSAYFENIKSKVRIQYAGARDANVQAMAGLAAGKALIEGAGGISAIQASAPSAQAGVPAGARPAASGYGKRKGPSFDTQPEAEAPQDGEQAAVQEERTFEQRLRAIAGQADQFSDNPRKMKAFLEQQLADNPDLEGVPGIALVTTQAARSLKGADGTPRARQIQQDGNTIWAKTKDAFHRLDKSNQQKAIRRVNARDIVVKWSKEIGATIEKVGYSKWYNQGKQGSFVANLTDDERRELTTDIKRMYGQMANAIRLEGGSDAIRAVSEWKIWLGLAGAEELGKVETFGDVADALERIVQNMAGNPDRAIRDWRSGHRSIVKMLSGEKNQHFWTDSRLYRKFGSPVSPKAEVASE